MYTVDELFSNDEWFSFHDVLSELDHEAGRSRREYSREHCRVLFEALPETVRDTAHQWSLGDTEFRDEAYCWLRDHTMVFNPTGDHKMTLPPGVNGVPSPNADNWGYEGCEFWIDAPDGCIEVHAGDWLFLDGTATVVLLSDTDPMEQTVRDAVRAAQDGRAITVPPDLTIDEAAGFVRKVIIEMGGDPDTVFLMDVDHHATH